MKSIKKIYSLVATFAITAITLGCVYIAPAQAQSTISGAPAAPGNSVAAKSKTASTYFRLRQGKLNYYYDEAEKKLYEINNEFGCRKILPMDMSGGNPQHRVTSASFSQTMTLHLDESPPNVQVDSNVRGVGNRIPIEVLSCSAGSGQDCKAQNLKVCE